MKKQAWILALCLCLCLTLIPMDAAATGGSYDPTRTNEMVLPGQLWANKNYMMGTELRRSSANYVQYMNNKAGTGVDLFRTKPYRNLETVGDGEITDVYRTDVYQYVALDEALNLNKGDAGISFTYGYRTMDSGLGMENIPNYTNVYVNGMGVGDNRIGHKIKQYAGLQLYKDGSWLSPLTWDSLSLGAITYTGGAFKGAAMTKDLAVYLVDNFAPYVVSCRIENVHGNLQTYVKPGDDLYITLAFSEDIRFADDQLHEPKLLMELMPDAFGDPVTVAADFSSLHGRVMTFTYRVPEVIGGLEGVRNFKLKRIIPLEESPEFTSKGADPSPSATEDDGFPVKLLPESKAANMNAPAIRSQTLVTDMAGNALRPNPRYGKSDGAGGIIPIPYIPVEPSPMYFDMKPPRVKSVSLGKTPYAVGPDGKESLFYTPGNYISVSVTFDEPITAAADTMTLELNIVKNGKTWVLTNHPAVNNQDRVDFLGQYIFPELFGRGDGAPQVIPTYLVGNGAHDRAGFPITSYNLESGLPMPTQQYFLDTLPPKVTGAFDAPLQVDGREDEICLPLNIHDATAAGVAVSGVNKMNGSFYLMNVEGYRWYVSQDGSLTSAALADLWQDAKSENTFPLYSGEGEYNTYLYLKFPHMNFKNPSVMFILPDVAGNIYRASTPITYEADRTGPVLAEESEPRLAPSGTGTYKLSWTARFQDPSGIQADSLVFEVADLPGTATLQKGYDAASGTFTLVIDGLKQGDVVDGAVTYTLTDGNAGHPNTAAISSHVKHSLAVQHLIGDSYSGSGYWNRMDLYSVSVEEALLQSEPKTLLLVQDPADPTGYAAAEFAKGPTIPAVHNILSRTENPDIVWTYYTCADVTASRPKLVKDTTGKTVDFLDQLAGSYYGDTRYVLISGSAVTLSDFEGDAAIAAPFMVSVRDRRVAGSETDQHHDLSLPVTVRPLGWDFAPVTQRDNTGSLSFKGSMPGSGTASLPAIANHDIEGRQLTVQLSAPANTPGFRWEDVESVEFYLYTNDTSTVWDAQFHTLLQPTDQPQVITVTDAHFDPKDITSYVADFQCTVRANYKFGATDTKASDVLFTLYKHSPFPYLRELDQNDVFVLPGNIRVLLDSLRTFPDASATVQELGAGAPIPLYLDGKLHTDSRNNDFYFEGESDGSIAFSCRLWNATDLTPEQEQAAMEAAPWGTQRWIKDIFPPETTKEGLNTLRYQIYSVSEGLSPVYTILFDISKQAPTLQTVWDPAPAEGFAARRSLTVTGLDSWGNPLDVTRIDPKTKENTPVTGPIPVTTADPMVFWTRGAGGGLAAILVTPEKLDVQAPVLTLQSHQLPNVFSFTLDDDYVDPDTFRGQLFLRYDDVAYTNLLAQYGLAVDKEGYFHVSDDFLDFLDSVEAGRRPDGRYGLSDLYINLPDSRDGARVNIGAVAPVGSGGYSGTMSAYYVDSAGRKSNVLTSNPLTVSELEVSVRFQDGSINSGSPDLAGSKVFYAPYSLGFSSPVQILDLDPRNIGSRGAPGSQGVELLPYDAYTMTRKGLPVYGPGTYSVRVADAFGMEHTLSYTVPAYDAAHPETSPFHGDDLAVTMVNAVDDSGSPIVKVYLVSGGSPFQIQQLTEADYAADGNRPGLDPAVLAGQGSVFVSDGQPGAFDQDYTAAQLHVTKNGAFRLWIQNDDGSRTERILCVLTNQEPAPLKVLWNYPNGLFTDEAGRPYTNDYAMAEVVSADPLRQVVSGGSCAFTASDAVGASHTLTVTDDRGVRQQYTVTLPVAIHALEQGYTEPPELHVTLSAQRNSQLAVMGVLTQTDDFASLMQSFGEGTLFQMNAATYSPNAVKAVVLEYQGARPTSYADARSAVIDGVTIAGMSVTVTRPDARFSLVLIDEKNRCGEALDFDGGWLIDTQAPTVESHSQQTRGYEGVEILLTVTDDHASADQIVPVAPAGVTLGADGKFHFLARENKEYVFLFRDRCGNVNTNQPGARVPVTEVDDTIPQASVTAYSPCAPGDQTRLPALTGQSVTAYVSFSKNILFDQTQSQPRLEIVEGSGVTMRKVSENSVQLIFDQDASVRIHYTALNGRSGKPLTVSLPSGTIDKTAPRLSFRVVPQYRIQENGANYSQPYAARIEVSTADEDFLLAGRTYTARQPFTQTVAANGSYPFTFTDRAGNLVNLLVPVTRIDDAPFRLTAEKVPTQWTAGSGFTLKVSKPCVLMLPAGLSVSAPGQTAVDGGTRVTMNAAGSLAVTLDKAGFYQIFGTDLSGSRVSCFASTAGDSIAPRLRQQTDRTYLRQGTPAAAAQVLTAGLTVSDNRTAPENITYDIDRSQLPPDFDRPGIYGYTVRARDEAGNLSQPVRRWLEVYSSDETAVLIDGVFARNGGVAAAAAGMLDVTVSLPASSVRGGACEPYKLYCAPGYLTAGEMKPFLHPLAPEGVLAGTGDLYRYSFSNPGWYTVLVLRQDRTVFLTHLLVQ